MKKFRFLTMAAAVALMLGACSDDNLPAGGGSQFVNPGVDDGVYFSININLPTASGTRSETVPPGENGSTSNTGFEIGKKYENDIEEVLIVLSRSSSNATINNDFIAAASVPKKEIKEVNPEKAAYKVTSSFSKTQLAAFYSTLNATNPATEPENFECNIYVFANPTESIRKIIFGTTTTTDGVTTTTGGAVLGQNTWIDEISTIGTAPASNSPNIITSTIAIKRDNGSGRFLMSNALVATRTIPESIDNWRFYTTDGNPFDLSGPNEEIGINNGIAGRGAVKLERAAARFDFRDGSPLVAEGKPFQYHVVYTDVVIDEETEEVNTTATSVPIIDVKLINMSLVNLNTKFYPLRRVAELTENGVPQANTIKICSPELPWSDDGNGGYIGGNYVIDANYTWKNEVFNAFKTTDNPVNIAYSTNLFYPFFNNDGTIENRSKSQWFTQKCENVVKTTVEDDNDNDWNPGTDEDGNVINYGAYKIWTYASENTCPGSEQQINGYSTGVVFKAKMVGTTDADVLASLDDDTKALVNAINNPGEVLYQFGGSLYLGWSKIREAALISAIPNIIWKPKDPENPDNGEGEWTFDGQVDRSNSLYVAVFGNGGFGEVSFTYTEYELVDGKREPVLGADGKPVKHTGVLKDNFEGLTDTNGLDPNSADYLWDAWKKATGTNIGTAQQSFKEAATGAKISIYESYSDPDDGNGYYMYYYYWNRHDDNRNNGIMQPMEFAVVRNNVYKLAVTDIKKLGHPRISVNDPEKPVGGTPDEKENVYISVTCEVLPWVVRVNNIEF